MESRKYDVIIYGATGFTGTLTAEYFAQNTGLPKDRWAIAGRSTSKLSDVKAHLVGIDPHCGDIGVIEANSSDAASLEHMTAQGKVVVSTVGPYALHGEPLVKACIDTRTHYLDITGEPNFVAKMLKKYHDQAKENSTLVINCCGFDSIPADLGVFFTVQQFENKDKPITIKSFVSSKGQFSGGTWASALNAMAEGLHQKTETNHSGNRPTRRLNSKIHFDKRAKKWAVPMPVIDPWIVRRSASAHSELYGPEFEYGQYLGLKNLPMVAGLLTGVGIVYAGAQFKPTRELLMKFRQSGEGPSAEQRANHHFRLTFYAESGDQKIKTSVQGGDPGYTETSKMLSECAMTILEDYDDLDQKGGVVTTAAALGDHLLKRLQSSGILFKAEQL